jgi:uncharacterized protein
VSRVLTIVGASVRAAACSAVRAGFSVYAGDMFADVDLRRCCEATQVTDYPDGLAAILRGPQAGGWMYTGGLENEPALIREMSQIRPLWGNSVDVLRRVRHPKSVTAALRAAALPCPQVAFDAADVPRDGTWLRKPFRSAGGVRISVWGRHPTADSGSATHYYFQRHIEGLSCSAVYVAAGGKARLLGMTRQLIGAAWAGARDFRYCGSIGPLDAPPVVASGFAEIGTVLARRFELVGLFGVDAVVNARGVWPVEVNPRYPASAELLDWAWGVPAVALHVAACEAGQLPSGPAPARHSCGKAIVFAPHRCVVSAELGARIGENDHRVGPTLADVPAPGTIIEAGWPIVTVLADAPDEQLVLEQLRRLAAQVLSAVFE